ncbi:MAG: SxtJ family membrane protein [Gemmatimonadaceae bacterium]
MAEAVPARLTRPQTPRELRSFALSVGGAFVALGALLYWRGGTTVGGILGGIGVLLATAGVVAPSRLGPLYRTWMRLALAISRVTTPVFMGIVYFAVLTPIGLAMRLFGRRVLSRPRGAPTYWVNRPAGARRSDLRRQF